MSYLDEKRTKVLKEIKPICKVFGIESYDYEIDDEREFLRLNNTRIGCSLNSISAIIDELVGYIFIHTFYKNRSMGAYERQFKRQIQQHWVEEELK